MNIPALRQIEIDPGGEECWGKLYGLDETGQVWVLDPRSEQSLSKGWKMVTMKMAEPDDPAGEGEMISHE